MSNDPTTKVLEMEDQKKISQNIFQYPFDLGTEGTNNTQAIRFFAFKYDKTAVGRFEYKTPLNEIYMPVPPELSTGDVLEYDSFSAAALQAAVEGMRNDGNLMQSLGTIAGDIINKFGKDDAKYASATAGVAINPRNANVFKTPKPREYQFTYKMIATNITESDMIYNIVTRFRQHAYPDVAWGEQIFHMPSIFDIQILQRKEGDWVENDYMFKPLPCALVAMNVTYNGASPVIFFKDSGAPVEVTLTLAFLEMELDNRLNLNRYRYKGF